MNPRSAAHRERITCCVRGESVAATPEEVIRQKCLSELIECGYPRECLIVECTLTRLQQLGLRCNRPPPSRRIDILALYNHLQFGWKPLLLIECKAHPLNVQAIRQLQDYNHTLKAPFIMGYGSNGPLTSHYDWVQRKYLYHCHLFSYRELLKAISGETTERASG